MGGSPIHREDKKPSVPRLNKRSLKQMAERHRTSIQASAYRSRLLTLFQDYLTYLIEELNNREQEPYELMVVEKDLEAIEAALMHLWVLLPYNEVLTMPNRLPEDQIVRLKEVLGETKKLRRHLRLAHSRAA